MVLQRLRMETMSTVVVAVVIASLIATAIVAVLLMVVAAKATVTVIAIRMEKIGIVLQRNGKTNYHVKPVTKTVDRRPLLMQFLIVVQKK